MGEKMLGLRSRWPDLVLTAGGLILALNLLPVVLSPEAVVPVWSSVGFIVVLSTYVAALWRLGARLGALTTLFQVAGWVFVALWRHP